MQLASSVEWLRTRPWEARTAWSRLGDVPTMLTTEERSLLYVLAREFVDDDGGYLIDGGCFLGGSTLAFAEGIRDRPTPLRLRRPIHTYDLFTLDEPSYLGYTGLVGGLRPGDRTRQTFERNLGALGDLVEVHEGDIRAERWTGEPISVLFIDVAKSWEINDHVNREFMPSLRVGSVVVQQDYVHEWTPWLHIGMELLRDRFLYAGSVASSAVFVATKPVTPDDLPSDLWSAVGDAEKLQLFDRSAERFAGEDRGVVEGSRAVLMLQLGQGSQALEHLRLVEAEWDSPRVRVVVPAVRGYVEGMMG